LLREIEPDDNVVLALEAALLFSLVDEATRVDPCKLFLFIFDLIFF
jgi:hypothetical protein